MLERARRCLRFCSDLEAHWAELHLRDGLVPVTTLGRSRESNDVAGPDLAENALELDGRDMVALVNDDLTEVCDDIGNGALSNEALDHRHVQPPRWRAPRAGDLADLFRIDTEEESELSEPLIE